MNEPRRTDNIGGRMRGRVALVTGSSRGIGRATVIALAQEGVDVVVNYLNNGVAAEEVVGEVKALGREALSMRADVRDPEAVAELVDCSIAQFGHLDILVNNAGINRDSSIRKMTDTQWEEVIDVNLKGVFNCTRAVVGHMMERGYGRIVNVTSVVGHAGVFGTANYSAAKAGIAGFTRTAAIELALKGVTVNAVALGYFDTGMLKRLPEPIQEDIKERIPMRRFGMLDEATWAIVFLVSPRASYITGQVLHVSGGHYL